MIIYGTKAIPLKIVDIPLACSNCGHGQRHIHVFRNFFSLFFIPVLPLNKGALIHCPNCKKEQTKKEFLKEFEDNKDAAALKEQLKSMIREAKVPLYAYATTALAFCLVFGFAAFIYNENSKSSALAASYGQGPTANVLAIVRDQEEAFPYGINYISHIQDQEAVIFQWKYSYASQKDAQKDLLRVKSSISGNNLKKNFLEPVLVPLDAFHKVDFVHILPLSIAAVDLEQFQKQVES